MIDYLGHTAPIETEIKNLAHALEAVKEEQEYIVVREKLHRNSKSYLTAQFRFKFTDRVLIHKPPNRRTIVSSGGHWSRLEWFWLSQHGKYSTSSG